MSGPQRMRAPSTKAENAASFKMRRPKLRKISNDPRAPLGGCRWRGNLPVPKHAHWAVRKLIEHLNAHQTTMTECTARAGIARTSVWSWCNLYHPRIDELEAALNAVGLRLAIEAIPDE